MSAAEPHHEELSDEQLLLRYRTANDQAAFAMLVRRYHQLVLGVCQQALGHRQDAEDAFQATFVVLAKDARRIRKPTALANWLFGVAYRISMQVRRQRARNRTVAVQDHAVDPTALNPLDHLTRRYQQGVAYDELSRLPDRLRTPMILCYLSGKSNQEIASQLKLTEAAVEGRLKRAKAKLRVRLTGHGVTLAVALSMLQVETASADTSLLLESTIDQCLTHSATDTVSAEAAEIVQLANQEIVAMTTISAVKLGIYGAVAVCATALTLTLHPLTAASWASGPFEATDTVEVQSPFGEFEATTDSEVEVRVAAADESPFADGGPDPEPAGQPAFNDPFDIAQPFAAATDDPFGADGDAFGNGQKPAKVPASQDPINSGPVAAMLADGAQKMVDMKRRSPSEMRIKAALSKPTTFDFLDEPLTDAMDYVSEVHGIQIVIDRVALEDVGLTDDTPVNFQISGIPLRNALNLAFRQLHLEHVIHDEVLLVTTKEVADKILDTRVYPFKSDYLQQTQIVEFVTSAIAPASWAEVGGEGFIAPYPRGLLIRQTPKVHDEIAELFRQFLRSDSAAD